MPSSYTAPVLEGEITEFPDFARRCARGMGALITMRDVSLDAPLPERIEADTGYYRERLEADVAELNQVVAWNDETAEAEARLYNQQALKDHLKSLRERRQQKARYELMLLQAEAWQPPTDEHAGLKEFMIKQLQESMEFDTGHDLEQHRPHWLSGQEYKAKRLENLAHSIQFDTDHLFGEQDRAASRNAWVQELQTNLASWEPVSPPVRQLP